MGDRIFDFITAYFPPEVAIFLLGAILGFGSGLFVASSWWDFFKTRLAWKREDREKECQEQKQTEQLAARERARQGLFYTHSGRLSDADGRFYCSHCLEDAIRTELTVTPIQGGNYYHCPRCNR